MATNLTALLHQSYNIHHELCATIKAYREAGLDTDAPGFIALEAAGSTAYALSATLNSVQAAVRVPQDAAI